MQFGVTEYNKPLKKLNEKEEVSTLVNWVINQLPVYESMDLRHRVNGKLYQTKLHKKGREISVGRPKEKDEQAETVTYDWPEHVTYETLDVNIITISAIRADTINAAKKRGQVLSQQEVTARVVPQIDWNMEGFQMGENGERVLTAEDMELINEFLCV